MRVLPTRFDPLPVRLRSSLARSSRRGVSIPEAFASSIKNSSYPCSLSPRTMLRSAAFASSVVASMPIVLPRSRPLAPIRFSTQSKTASWVATSISRRVREIVE